MVPSKFAWAFGGTKFVRRKTHIVRWVLDGIAWQP
jgi:hypothetical protein